MTRYYAYTTHHSDTSADYDMGDDRHEAIARAHAELDDGFVGHRVVVRDRQAPEWAEPVAQWTIGNADDAN